MDRGRQMGWSLRNFWQKIIIVIAVVMVGLEMLQSQWVSNAVLDFCFGGVIPGTDTVIDPDIVLGVAGLVLMLLAVWLARHRLDDFVYHHPVSLSSPRMSMRPPSRVRSPLPTKLAPKPLRPAPSNTPTLHLLQRTTQRLDIAGQWLTAGGTRVVAFCRQAMLTVVMSCVLTYSLLIFGLVKGLRWVLWSVGYALRMMIWALATVVRLLVWSAVTALRWLLWSLLAAARTVIYVISSSVRLSTFIMVSVLKLGLKVVLSLIYACVGLGRSLYLLSVITWRRSEPHLRRTDAWLEARAHKFYHYLERKAVFHPSLRFGLTAAANVRRRFDKIRQFEGL